MFILETGKTQIQKGYRTTDLGLSPGLTIFQHLTWAIEKIEKKRDIE